MTKLLRGEISPGHGTALEMLRPFHFSGFKPPWNTWSRKEYVIGMFSTAVINCKNKLSTFKLRRVLTLHPV